MRLTVLLTPILLLWACEDTALVGPTADFSWSPACDLTPRITVVGDVSQPGDGEIIDWFWELGHDDQAGVGMVVEHVYPYDGVFPVSLTVVDDNGLADTVSRDLELDRCLDVVSAEVVVDGGLAWGTAEVHNLSGVGDAAPCFEMDLLDDGGLPRFATVDAGQHTIALDQTVTVTSEQVSCGDDCDRLDDVEVRASCWYWAT